jgi:hypothetical protein
MGKAFFSRKSKSDFFETPYSMTEQLLENEKFDYNKIVLECAYGYGAIVNILLKHFNTSSIYGYDKYTPDCYSQDFLKEKNINKFDYIITNPPFSLWDKFVEKAKEVAIEKFAFLGRLEFLTGLKRHEENMYYDSEYPLTKVYYFIRKVNLSFFDKEEELKRIESMIDGHQETDNLYYKKLEEIKKKIDYPCLREDGKYPTGMYHYCWFIFEKINNWQCNNILRNTIPRIIPINNHKYILNKKG